MVSSGVWPEVAGTAGGRTSGRWRGWWRLPVLFVGSVVLVRTANVAGFAAADAVPMAGVDPDGAWAPMTVHHLVQATLILAVTGVVVLTGRAGFADLGLTTRQWRWSLRVAAGAGMMWLVVQVSFGYLFLTHGVGSTDPGYPLTAGNVVGDLAFSALSGAGEEPMYRGLVMTGFVLGAAPLISGRHWLAGAAIAGSTAVFMIDHIGVRSFSIDPLQEATVLVLGVVYGLMFWRTRSLVGPVVLHGLVNVIVNVTGYWFYLTL